MRITRHKAKLRIATAVLAFCIAATPAAAGELILPGVIDLSAPAGFSAAEWCPELQGPLAEVKPIADQCFYETTDDIISAITPQIEALLNAGWRSPENNSGIAPLLFLRAASKSDCADVLHIDLGHSWRGEGPDAPRVNYVRYTVFKDPACAPA